MRGDWELGESKTQMGAMLAELGWKVIRDPEKLLVKVASAKYRSKENFLGFNNVEIHPRS